MFDISFTELMVIGVVALVVIGPERLPGVARTAGALLGRLQRYVSDVKADVQREMRLEEMKKLQAEVEAQARGIESQVRTEMQSVEKSVGSAVASVEGSPGSPGSPASMPADSSLAEIMDATGQPVTEQVAALGVAAPASAPAGSRTGAEGAGADDSQDKTAAAPEPAPASPAPPESERVTTSAKSSDPA